MTLTTERLVLRPFRAGDFEAVHAYASDPAVTRYTSFGPNTQEQTREFLARCEAESSEEKRSHYNLAVTFRGEDRVVGGAGFNVDHPLHGGAELGYVLHKDVWGKGVAAESAGAMIDFAFGTLGLHRIVARCHPANMASARVMEKVGMQYEGRQREVMYLKGEWWDFLVYAILVSEWRERKGLPPVDDRSKEIL